MKDTSPVFCEPGATFTPWNILAGVLLLIVVLALTGLNETLRVLDEERWTSAPAATETVTTTAPESEAAK